MRYPLFRKILILAIVSACLCNTSNARAGDDGKKHVEITNIQMLLVLLETKMVDDELELSASQKVQLAPLSEAFEAAIRSSSPDGDASDEESEAKYAKNVDQAQLSFRRRIQAILTVGKLHRLEEMYYQFCGSAIFEEDMRELLEFSPDQAMKIERIRTDCSDIVWKSNQELGLDEPQSRTIERHKRAREQVRKCDEIEKDAVRRIEELLSPIQRKYVKQMSGAEIDTLKLGLQIEDVLDERRRTLEDRLLNK